MNKRLKRLLCFVLSLLLPAVFLPACGTGQGGAGQVRIPKSKKVDMFAQIQASILALYKTRR